MPRYVVKLRRVVENTYVFDFDGDAQQAREWVNENRDDFVASGDVEKDESRIVSLKLSRQNRSF